MNPSSPKPSILMVLENYYPNIGGVETLFQNLAEQVAQQGFKVIIVTRRLSPQDPAFERHKDVEIHRYRFANRYVFTFLAFFPLLKHIRKAALVHTTSYNAALPAFFAAAFFKKKTLITFHEVWANLWFKLPGMSRVGGRLHYAFEQFILRLPFDRFIGVSDATSKRLLESGIPSNKVQTILNGIIYNEFPINGPKTREVPNTHFNYTFFGRLGVSKGLDLLLPAAARFHDQYPDTHLNLIVPKTPKGEYQKLLQTLEKLSFKSGIRLYHELPFEELQAIIRGSDGVVIPSYSEGFCFAAVETMALGIPIIHSGKGALSEVIGGHDIQMESFDEEGLFKALVQARAGNWSIHPEQRYPLSKTISQYMELYESLLNHSKTRG